MINDAGDNRYGRPIANLHPVMDLAAGKVRVDDFGVVSPRRPRWPSEGLRDDVKPLDITQPEGRASNRWLCGAVATLERARGL